MWWETRDHPHATCLFGEITVLATDFGIYYCGANWHPGEPAGGYCGIQHNSAVERRTIFSVWDTGPGLQPRVTKAAPDTILNRFTNEGEGGHTHMAWDWKCGETFQFFVNKQPGQTAGTTDARYFVYDRARNQWRYSATIASPDGDAVAARSVAHIGGGSLACFLEDFLQRNTRIPKLALHRLWLGTTIEDLTCLTEVVGDGIWGVLSDSYFLAAGGAAELDLK